VDTILRCALVYIFNHFCVYIILKMKLGIQKNNIIYIPNIKTVFRKKKMFIGVFPISTYFFYGPFFKPNSTIVLYREYHEKQKC